MGGCGPRGRKGRSAAASITPEVGQGVPEPDRVVVELAAVVDAAEARAQQEFVRGEHLVPEVLDRSHLGEEPVTAEVEPPSVTLDRPADSPDHLIGLDDHDRISGRCEPMGGREAGRPGTDDHDRRPRRGRRLLVPCCHQP